MRANANKTLLMHKALERCGTCKRDAPLFTKNHTGVEKERVCATCLGKRGQVRSVSRIKELLAMPTRNGG